ncbi:WYL domain-containing protein [Chitinophaga rhizophila]|uniref:WYL domain-containing protein n=1 Tax=Chitinophaga rhizophila TaxID=2866212 RepID=A0ABS7GMB3_9BACT|nr:WYL domain-containing protein [Chitinophaga rhizophila]MBW8687748.1 WYL domain-containing protein [Chitinophaga rhizophila]
MNVLDILAKAIKNRHQISFQYNKEGKTVGKRIGNPYAIFIFTAKNTRIQSTKVHIVQTSGVSDSAEIKPFPSFRTYNIEELSEVQVLGQLPQFTQPFHESYNPEWDGYKDVIAKV